MWERKDNEISKNNERKGEVMQYSRNNTENTKNMEGHDEITRDTDVHDNGNDKVGYSTFGWLEMFK